VASGALDVYLDPQTYLVTQANAQPTRVIEAIKAQQPDIGELKISYDLTQVTVPSTTPMPADAFSVTPPPGATAATTLPDLFQMPPLEQMVDFTLPSLTEGKTVQLSDYKGKVILLDFWQTTCPPCQEELPVLQGLYKEFADKGFVLLAVNLAEDRQKVADFLKRQSLDIPVVLDTDGKVGDAYRIGGLPTTYLIGRDGKVLQYLRGYGPGREDELRKDITDALAAPAPPAAPQP
jgi:thiol-disulfide isomerase/thioredoxin